MSVGFACHCNKFWSLPDDDISHTYRIFRYVKDSDVTVKISATLTCGDFVS
jgi:hypothetical protein